MKIERKLAFSPITITLETLEEAEALADMCGATSGSSESQKVKIATSIYKTLVLDYQVKARKYNYC